MCTSQLRDRCVSAVRNWFTRVSIRIMKVLRLPIMLKASLTSAVLFATLSFAHHAQALEWALNKEQSRITFEMIAPDGSLTGQFEQFEAEIRFDPDYLDITEIRAAIDMNTVVTGNPSYDEMLRGPQWLDTQTYPAAGFVVTSLNEGGTDGQYMAQGNLTIRGVSAPVSLPVSVSIDKGDARITGETVIDRNSFGIGADGSGGQGSQGDIVVIKIDLLTTRLDN
jgi:polyisoprenoid-binding protein YceI